MGVGPRRVEGREREREEVRVGTRAGEERRGGRREGGGKNVQDQIVGARGGSAARRRRDAPGARGRKRPPFFRAAWR